MHFIVVLSTGRSLKWQEYLLQEVFTESDYIPSHIALSVVALSVTVGLLGLVFIMDIPQLYSHTRHGIRANRRKKSSKMNEKKT